MDGLVRMITSELSCHQQLLPRKCSMEQCLMKAMMKRTHELSLFEVGISNVVGLEPLANLKLDRQCRDSESPATSAKEKERR